MKDKIVVKTLFGLEKVLAKEISDIGGKNIEIGNRMVSFSGGKEELYRANFYLRTAIKVLRPIFTFNVENEEDLYQKVYAINWQELFSRDKTFAIDPVVFSPNFNHSLYAGLKMKDAIADRFRADTGRRPSVDPDDPDILFNMHISDTTCTISLDSSGQPLYKRGYRTAQGIAPLNEALAAGMIYLSGWKPGEAFVDPMCGSGTLLIEAAMMAHGIAPGIYRKSFSFEKWNDYDEDLFNKIYNEETTEPEKETIIQGSDIDARAVNASLENSKNASLKKYINVKQCSVEQAKAPAEKGTIIVNPPYGERMMKGAVTALYQTLGSAFKHKFNGFNAFVLSSNKEAMKNIGLKPYMKYNLYNGKLACFYHGFQLYSGSKKIYKQKQ